MKVFISYTWENDKHMAWVETLAARLCKDGIKTTLDQWDVNLGDELSRFMEEGIWKHDRVLIICTPEYKWKADNRLGGAGYETRQITAEVLNGCKQGKFIPVLRIGSWRDALPAYLQGISGVNLCDGDNARYEKQYNILLADLSGKQKKAPPVGVPTSETKLNDFKLSFLQDKLMGRAWRVGPNDIRYEDGLLMNRERAQYIARMLMDNALLTGSKFWIVGLTGEEFEGAIQENIWKNGNTVYTYSEPERWAVLNRSAKGLEIRLGRMLGSDHVECKVMDNGDICYRYRE